MPAGSRDRPACDVEGTSTIAVTLVVSTAHAGMDSASADTSCAGGALGAAVAAVAVAVAGAGWVMGMTVTGAAGALKLSTTPARPAAVCGELGAVVAGAAAACAVTVAGLAADGGVARFAAGTCALLLPLGSSRVAVDLGCVI